MHLMEAFTTLAQASGMKAIADAVLAAVKK